MRKIVYPLIWLAVTAAAVLIASAAVSSVRDQVTDTPTAMLPPTTIAISSTEQLVAKPVQPEPPTPTTTEGSSVTTTSSPATTTTTAPASDAPEPIGTTVPSTPTTTTVPATTTTTTTPPKTEVRSYDLVGGSVSVEIGDGTVRLAGASPKPGFTMDVESPGPEKVEVEFHNDDHESRFTGKFHDGEFKPSITESDGEDDD